MTTISVCMYTGRCNHKNVPAQQISKVTCNTYIGGPSCSCYTVLQCVAVAKKVLQEQVFPLSHRLIVHVCFH